MASIVTLIRMKLAALRHYLKGGRLLIFLWQACFALAGVVITLLVAINAPESAAGVIALTSALWVLGWALGPTLFGGEDPMLRPEFFRNLPIKPGKLAFYLTLTSVAGIGAPITLLAFSSFVIYGSRLGVSEMIVGMLFMPLLLFFAIFLGRVITNALRALTRSNISSLLSSALIGAVMAFFVTGWATYGTIGSFLSNGLPTSLQSALFYLPSSWPIVAINSVNEGNWLAAGLLAVAMIAVTAVLSWIWGKLLAHRLTTSHTTHQLRRRRSLFFSGKSYGPIAATVCKELLTWARDYTRSGFLYFAFFFSIFTCLYPISVDVYVLLLFAGVLYIISAVGATSNLYGVDGTALWQIIITPGAPRNDVRGRQIAWLIILLTTVIPTTLLFVWWSGIPAAWPAVAGVTAAALGAGAGVAALLSVYRLIPMTDPHLRGDDMFENGMDWWQFMLSIILTSLLTAPVVGLIWYSLAQGQPDLQWWAIVLGAALGAFWFWLLGKIAYRRLEGHGSDILDRMRKSSSSAAFELTITKKDLGLDSKLNKKQTALVYTLFTLAPILLFPQGIVAGMFKLINLDNKAWFLPLYLPSAWQWPAIVVMIALGLSFFWIAHRMYQRANKNSKPSTAKGKKSS
jgi:ABC-2 type transport system permease protein